MSFQTIHLPYMCMVIGNPIAHSKSPQLHQAFAQQAGVTLSYEKLLCPNDKGSFVAVVEAFFAGDQSTKSHRGANVTVPFKEMAFDLVKQRGELSEYAKMAGAVNTLAYKDGKLYGDNTDGRGLVTDLLAKGVALEGKNVAILGAGGATRGAILPLLQAGANIVIFNRTVEKAENLVALFTPLKVYPSQNLLAKKLDTPHLTGVFDVIINATSAGATGQSLNLQDTDMIACTAYDMMYGKRTEFLQHFGQFSEVTCYDGLGMLIHQGALSFELWTGQKVDMAKLGNPLQ